MRLRYLPHSMHVAYMAKDKILVGRVNWQLLAHALKSFTGHYKGGPTAIGVRRRTEDSLLPYPSFIGRATTTLLHVHWIGPTLTAPDSAFGPGQRAPISATNPGSVA